MDDYDADKMDNDSVSLDMMDMEEDYLVIQSVPHHRNENEIINYLRRTGGSTDSAPSSPATKPRVLALLEEEKNNKRRYVEKPKPKPSAPALDSNKGAEVVVVDPQGGFMFLYDTQTHQFKSPFVMAMNRNQAENVKKNDKRPTSPMIQPVEEDDLANILPVIATPLLMDGVSSATHIFNANRTSLRGYDLDPEYVNMQRRQEEADWMRIEETSAEDTVHSDRNGPRGFSGGRGMGMAGVPYTHHYRTPARYVPPPTGLRPRYVGRNYGYPGRGYRRGYYPYMYVPIIPSTLLLSAVLLSNWYPAGQNNYYYINGDSTAAAGITPPNLPVLPSIYLNPADSVEAQRDQISHELDRVRERFYPNVRAAYGDTYEIIPHFGNGNMTDVQFVWALRRA